MSEQSGSDSIKPILEAGSSADRLAALLDAAGLAYALIGGHAVNAWFVPRFTNDVDFLVAPSAELISRFEEAASALGYDYERRQDEGGASGPDFLRMVDSQGNAFDIQTAKTDYQMLVIARAIRSDRAGVSVATPEDLLIMKLIANRPKDRGDLLNLVERNGLDWKYIEHWADVWEVTGRLRSFRQIAAV